MADIYTPFHDALRSAIGTAWSDVPANGIYLDVQIAHFPFDRKLEADDLPLAIIEYQLRQDDRWGLCNHSESGPCVIHYVCGDSTLVESGLLGTKLEALRNILRTTGLGTAAQILPNPKPQCSVSAQLLTNRLFAEKGWALWGGAVTFEVLIGETE